jgi:hypothetical protein
MSTSRRSLLKSAAGLAAGLPLLAARGASAQQEGKRLKVAAVFTEFTYRSHAHVILENFLHPYLFNGEWIEPGMDVVSFFGDQFPERDMSRAASAEYGIPIFPTIDEALCLGGKELAVDAVLSIGEHGRYPTNSKGQREYPRKRFFDEIVAVFRRSGRVVPVFNDKHLSYRWDWAKEMYDTALEMKIPFMAGSSVPLAERRPPLELPEGARIEEAVSIHGGGFEGYDFHAMEVLQAMVEARKGGETGVRSVQFFPAEALWKAAEDGVWSLELGNAAMAAELGPDGPPLREYATAAAQQSRRSNPFGTLITYRDGLRAMVLKVGSSATRWTFACRLDGEREPKATGFYVGPWNNRNLFKALSHAIQAHFRQGRPPYPVERTLLVTGALDAEADSRARRGAPIETQHLALAYRPTDYRAMREMGASWKIITEQTPEPPGIDPGGKRPLNPKRPVPAARTSR